MQIEAGKFYLTANGDSVGPMEKWSMGAEHPWQEEGGQARFNKGGDIWRTDGTSAYSPALICEYVGPETAPESPTAAIQKIVRTVPRIVSGQYGYLSWSQGAPSEVEIDVDGTYTATDLREAAGVLLELATALEATQ